MSTDAPFGDDPRERRLQGCSLVGCQGGQQPVDDGIEEVAQGDEGDFCLGLGGPAREHFVAEVSRVGDPREPDRGLADSGVTLEDQSGTTPGDGIEERGDRVLLTPTPDDGRIRHVRDLGEWHERYPRRLPRVRRRSHPCARARGRPS